MSSNQELKQQIEYRVLGDTRIRAKNLTVEFQNNRVIIKGTVQSIAARDAAESDVWAVKGVKHIENRLQVEFPLGYIKPTDQTLKENLLQQIALDPDLYQENITCEVSDGKVLLQGAVGQLFKKFRATTIAKQTGGATEIKNSIAVVPTRSIEDRKIAHTITHHLQRVLGEKVNNIALEIENGHVILNGTVPDLHSFETTEDITRYTEGVLDIANNMVILS